MEFADLIYKLGAVTFAVLATAPLFIAIHFIERPIRKYHR